MGKKSKKKTRAPAEVPLHRYFFMALADLVASYDRKRAESGFQALLAADASLTLSGRIALGPVVGPGKITRLLARHGLAGVALDLPDATPASGVLERDFRWSRAEPVAGSIRLAWSASRFDAISLHVEHGRGGLVVPDCRGLSGDDARDRAVNTGFRSLVVQRVHDPRVPSGGIVRQFPRGGVVLGREGNLRRLNFVSSLGDPGVVLPTLDGLDREEAEARLAVLGFVLAGVRSDAGAPPGVVLASEPAGGSYVRPGAAVTLIVGG